MTDLPLAEKDPLNRLQFCSKEYQRLKQSAFIVFSHHWLMIMGLYFPSIISFLVNKSCAVTMLSNFPGGKNYSFVDGNAVMDITFLMGPVGDSGTIH